MEIELVLGEESEDGRVAFEIKLTPENIWRESWKGNPREYEGWQVQGGLPKNPNLAYMIESLGASTATAHPASSAGVTGV